MKKDNLFARIPEILPEEFSQEILRGGMFKMERIVSRGHVTPRGRWYDQDLDEWVLVVKGSGVVRFERGSRSILMNPGDFLLIPAHERHRVEWTSKEEDTIWLAIHFLPADQGHD